MDSARARVIALWLWILGQAGILALYAARVKLSGGYPEPVEATADLGLAIGQFILGVLLASTLFHNMPAMIQAAATAVVFAVLAGKLAGRSVSETVTLFAFVLIWLAAMGVWSRWAIARLGLTFLTIGLPILFYASLEYGSAPTSLHNWPWTVSPVLGVCSIRLHHDLWRPMIWSGGLLLTGLMARQSVKRRPALYCNVANCD